MPLDVIHYLQKRRRNSGNCERDPEWRSKIFPKHQISDKSPQRAVENFVGKITVRYGKSDIELVGPKIKNCTQRNSQENERKHQHQVCFFKPIYYVHFIE